MTSVTVSVAATWRLSRVEFNTPHDGPQSVLGYGEVLLEEPDEPSPQAALLNTGPVYGAMPSARVSRDIAAVGGETIEIEGNTVSFQSVMEAVALFFDKWRVEDVENPPAAPPTATMAIPKRAEFVPMPIGVLTPEEQLEPPKGIGL